MTRVLGAAALVVGAAAMVASCGGKAAEAARADAPAPAVTLGDRDVARAARATLVGGVPLSGPLAPKVSVTVGAPIAEQVVQMFVDVGDPVRQGQPLARFRDDVLRAAAASATADVANARMAATVAAAESSRAEALFAEGAIARRDHDNAMLGVEAARARLTLAQSQAASASDRLETATLTAPVNGVVSQRFAQAGDRVDFGKPVVTIVDNSVLELEAAVEARWLPVLAVGRPVSLTVSQVPGDTIVGRIARINPMADPATRQVRLYVDVANRGGRLVGGLFVSGRILVSQARDVVAVPQAAVRTEGAAQEIVIYVVTGDRVARRPVVVGLADPDRGLVEITSGVAAGDTVVVGPVDGLVDGTRITIARTGG